MRYDTPIYFQSLTEGDYDANTGDYSPDIVTEEKAYSSVSDCGFERLQLIYGDIKQSSLIVRLQRPYVKPFDRIRIGNTLYKVDLSRQKKSFYVSEVQKNG